MTVERKMPLILLADGYERWRILGPLYNYGKDLGLSTQGEDRRYEELAVVRGNLYDATDRLHQLERGRIKGFDLDAIDPRDHAPFPITFGGQDDHAAD